MFVNFFFIAWLGRKFEPNPLVVLKAHGMQTPPRAIPLLPSSIVNFLSSLPVRDEVEGRKHGPCGSYENG